MEPHTLPQTQGSQDNNTDTPRLPPELVIAVFEHVAADEDLLVLARVSRQFNTLSLERYFHNENFNLHSMGIYIHSAPSRRVLGGLALSLDTVGATIDFLSYDIGYSQSPTQMAADLKLLIKYISKLSSVAHASLHIGVNGTMLLKERRDSSLVLLNTILGKRCSKIEVVASQFTSINRESEDMYAQPSEWLTNYWPARHIPPTEQSLKCCIIRTFPRFLRPFYFHMLSTSSASITELTFDRIMQGGKDWATMLSHLNFPRLRQFTLLSSVISRDAFIDFLDKCLGTLVEFTYQNITYDPFPNNPARRAFGPTSHTSLEKLTTSPEHINNFLPSFASMLHLTYVCIAVEAVHKSDGLDDALRRLAACVNKITLSIVLPYLPRTGFDLGVWFEEIFSPEEGLSGGARPECDLYCVEMLSLDNGYDGFLWNTVNGTTNFRYILRWLRLFPRLKTLKLRVPPSRGRSYRGADLVAVLQAAYPGLSVKFDYI